MKDVFILGGSRTPFVKSFTSYRKISTQELMEYSLNDLVKKMGLQNVTIDDVALGALITSSKNWNLARECVLSSALNPATPAYNVQRACGTGLEAAYQMFAKIKIGSIDTAIAGGVDTNSDVPVEVNSELREMLLNLQHSKTLSEKIKSIVSAKFSKLGISMPGVVEKRTGLSMGEHCEKMVKEWNILQHEQDEIALRSHMNAVKAYQSGFYNDLIVPVSGISRDGFIREDTSMEKLAKLKPVFDKVNGTITAGNASPLSDGSSVVLLASAAGAQKLSLKPLAKMIDVEASAVDFVGGEGLLMAPTVAVAKLLKRNNLKLQDFDVYEIHEAFAGQVACTLKAWNTESYCKTKLGLDSKLGEIDQSKMNIVGGSVALGHPFAATGGRILSSLAKLLHGSQKRGLISICTAGGMGVAAIIEGVS
jgi:acetyl-CoA C-acetyltransferase